jgi:hypothetical protein
MALLDKVGSLSIQTRAEELVAMAEVKNCVASERDEVKNCKKEHSALSSKHSARWKLEKEENLTTDQHG